MSAKVLEVGVELLVESTNAWTNEPVGNRHALEAREPDPVGEENVVEGAVNRLEERAIVTLARFVTQRGNQPV